MDPSAPRPRYYRARRSKQLLAGTVVAGALVAGGAAVALGTDVLDRDEPGAESVAPLPGQTLPAGLPPEAATELDDRDDVSFDSVVVVGDSITQGSEAELRYVLTAQRFAEITIDGLASRRIEVGNGTSEPLNGVAALYELLAAGADPDVWVIALGTNDIGSYDGPEAYGALIDTVLGMLPEDDPVVWVDAWRPQYPEDTVEFRDVLRERIEARGDAVVASWYELASQPDQSILQRDGIHPNPDGRVAFATLVADAIAALD